MREVISCLESYSSCIKQETSNELSYTEKFIHIMEKVQDENATTKDVVLELMQLFYQNNSLFIQLFETSFLLIFKTYANEGARFNKYESQQIIQKYSQFLKSFLTQMINMELEVKKSKQEEQYFENFIDFYLTFFAQAITSSKSFIKEFSFNILVSSIKIIDEVLDVELLPETENHLIQSCLYLLGSNFQDFKKIGVQLYAMLKKIKITSIQCQELLFQIIECQSNFQLRKQGIIQGISLREQYKIDRFLNRLRDKNPLIIQLVIQKLINEKVKFENMTYQQRIKILIDGIGSHHVDVRQKSLQFLTLSLMRFLNINQLKKQQLKQNYQDQQSGLQRFLNLFNSDHFSTERKSNQQGDFLVKSISLECVSLLLLHLSSEIVKVEIKRLFRNIEDLTITLNQSALLFCFLKRISISQPQQVNSLIGDNKININKFINQADFLPSLHTIVTSIKNRLKNYKSIEETSKFGILLKTVHLLIDKFEVTDCAGKEIVCLQLKKFVIEFDCLNRSNVQRSNYQINEFYEQGYKQRLFEQQLRKLNSFFTKKQSTKLFILPVINHPLDLLSLAVQVMLSLSQKQRRDTFIQLKIHINELLDSRQLTLEREINTKMLINTCTEISKAQMGSEQTKPIQHLRVIRTQVEKRLIQNRNKVKNNNFKGFTILARVVSFEQKNFTINNGPNYSSNKSVSLIKASQFIEQIKSYLYNNQNGSQQQYQTKNRYNHYNYQSYSYSYLPHVLIYYYCVQSEQNYKLFRKLFYYYALEQDGTVLVNNPRNMLTKLINLRLLFQLQLQYSSIKCREQQQQQQSQQNDRRCSLQVFAQTLLSMLFDSNKCKQKEHNNNKDIQNLLLIQETLCQQILIKIFNSSVYYRRNIKFLTNLIMITLKQHFHSNKFSNQNNLFMKQLLLTFQQLSTQHSNQLYQTLLCVYQAFITLLCQYQQNQQNQPNLLQKSQIYLLLNKITQLFGVLFKITNKFINLNQHQSIQCLEKYFIRFLKMLNLFNKLLSNTQFNNFSTKLRLKNIFTHLFQHKSHYLQQQNPSNILHSQHVNTQLLIFTKRKVQQSLQLFKNNQELKDKDKTKQYYLIFLSDIQQIDQQLQQEISKRFQQKNNQYDQQSTDHSPNINLQNHSSTMTKINVNLIETYEETFNRNLKQKDQQIKNVIKYFEKNNILEYLILIWKQNNQQIQNNKTNQETIEDKNLDNQKIIENQHQDIIQNPKSDLSLIFDRRGRRKDKISDKYMKLECYQVKASIKKNRYFIIPFQIVQKAQFSSKRLKSQQKRLKKQKYAQEKSLNSIIYPKIQYFNV